MKHTTIAKISATKRAPVKVLSGLITALLA